MSTRWRVTAEKCLTGLVWLEQGVAVLLMGVILVSMGSQVVARYALGMPLSWSEEVAKLAMIWLTFIAAGFVAATNQHIAVDLFAGRGEASTDQDASASRRAASVPGQCLARLLDPRVASAIVLLTSLTLLIGGARFVWRVHPVGSPGTGISKSVWYGAAGVGLALISIHTLAELVGCRPRRAAEPADGGEHDSPSLASRATPENITTT